MKIRNNIEVKVYLLSVLLASIVGLLFAVVPLTRSVFEYRSPSPKITEPRELSSFELFVVTKANKDEANRVFYGDQDPKWKDMYEAAKSQYAETRQRETETIRRRAGSNVIAYGALAGLCVLLLATHLLWVRRLASHANSSDILHT